MSGLSARLSKTAPYSYDAAYDAMNGPAALVFSDNDLRRERIASALALRGARVVAAMTTAAMIERLDAQADAALVLCDIDQDDADADRLIGRMRDLASSTATRGVVIVDEKHLDTADAGLHGIDVALLVAPDEREIVRALDEMLAPAEPPSVADSSSANGRRLAELSEEVQRIARSLAALSANDMASPQRTGAAIAREPASDLALVRAVLRMRRLREQFFEPELFADPAWDMLLDLLAARIEQRSVAVSSLCIAAVVPPTTALRWISMMTAHGLLVRTPDPEDRRRVFIALSERAATAMFTYLAAASQVMQPAR